jgi:benzoylformate decarboxylase
MTRTGRDALLEVLRSEGVTHLFGNPGTTELPLMDALATADDLRYVLALQEATAVGMADGYAQVTGRPAVLNLHTSAGLGNAIGNLTNAQANGTPLVVTAGQQDRRHLHHDPLLAGDLVGLAQSVSKWTHEVSTLGELATVLRRAFHDAASAPAGPVFVSIPMDVLEEAGEAPVPPPSTIVRGAVAGGLDELARRLAAAAPDRLLLVAGDEVAASGAVPALTAVA